MTKLQPSAPDGLRKLGVQELQRMPLETNRILIRAYALMTPEPDPRLWGAWLATIFPCPQEPRVFQKIRSEVLAEHRITP